MRKGCVKDGAFTSEPPGSEAANRGLSPTLRSGMLRDCALARYERRMNERSTDDERRMTRDEEALGAARVLRIMVESIG